MIKSSSKYLICLFAISLGLAGCSSNLSRSLSTASSSFSERDVTVTTNGVTRHLHVNGDAKFENAWPVSATKGTVIDISQTDGNKLSKAVQFRKSPDKLELFMKSGNEYTPATAEDEQWTRKCLQEIAAQNGMLNGEGWASESSFRVGAEDDSALSNKLWQRASDVHLQPKDQLVLVDDIFRKEISSHARKRALLALCQNPSLTRAARTKIVTLIEEIPNHETREEILKSLALQ